MHLLVVLTVIFSFHTPLFAYSDSTAHPPEFEIARSVRAVVQNAGADLLNSTVLGAWRDHLMVAAANLSPEVQPLLLIKFDQDVVFRGQFKELIAWESTLEKQENAHFIYYYKLEQPVPRLLISTLDTHFRSVTKLFGVAPDEKIPYRFVPGVEQTRFYPFDDLRGGIVSGQPVDFHGCAQAIFSAINPNIVFMTQPLARMYGTFFQNETARRAFYEKCLHDLSVAGYTSALQLYTLHGDGLDAAARFSAYAFVYRLHEQYGVGKVGKFLSAVNDKMSQNEFLAAFKRIFEIGLAEFEGSAEVMQRATKL